MRLTGHVLFKKKQLYKLKNENNRKFNLFRSYLYMTTIELFAWFEIITKILISDIRDLNVFINSI